MASAQEILQDPNYVNANAATKRAIFDKHIANTPDYQNANAATKKAIEARFGLASAPAAAPARKAKPSDQVFERSELLSLPSAAIYTGAKELGLGATELAGRGLRAVGLETPGNALVRMAQTGRAETPPDVARAQQAYPNAFAGLKLGSQMVMTAPIGGIVAKPLYAAARTAPRILPLANAVETAGMRVLPAAGGPVARTALRAAGGATVGGTTAALINPEDADVGAVLGAAVPTVGVPLAVSIAKGGAKAAQVFNEIVDYFKGRSGDVRAGELLREAFGGDAQTISNILRNAPDELTARQAMADAGIDADAVYALGAQVEKRNLSGAFSRIAELADAKRKQLMALASGGATQEEARAAREAAKGRLTEATTPMREEALGMANIGGTVGQQLRGYAGQFGDEATQQVENVRRFTRAGESAAAASEPFYPILGQPRAPGKYTYMGELPTQAEQRAAAAAEASLAAGTKARDAAARAADLEAAGLKPLTSESIVSNIQRKLEDPTIGVDKINRRVLTAVSREIERWTKANGIIDARALYEIRKSAVNAEVQRLMPSADAAAQKARAAQILSQLKPVIDDAIENAGGKGWGEYIRTFSTGMDDIARQKLVAKAQQLYADNPQGFMRLVQGNDPKAVEKALGPGSYEILQEMAGQLGPSRLGVLGQVGRELARDEQIALRAAAGEGRIEALLAERTPIRLHLLNVFSSLGNKGLDIMERAATAAERKALDAAFRSGKSMAQALQVFPRAKQNKILAETYAETLGRAYQMPAAAAAPRAIGLATPQPNTMAPPVENRNAMAR